MEQTEINEDILLKIDELIEKLKGQDRRYDDIMWGKVKENITTRDVAEFVSKTKCKSFTGASEEFAELTFAGVKARNSDLVEILQEVGHVYMSDLTETSRPTFAATIYMLYNIKNML